MLFAHSQIDFRELNGALSSANCARKSAGPLIVFMFYWVRLVDNSVLLSSQGYLVSTDLSPQRPSVFRILLHTLNSVHLISDWLFSTASFTKAIPRNPSSAPGKSSHSCFGDAPELRAIKLLAKFR